VEDHGDVRVWVRRARGLSPDSDIDVLVSFEADAGWSLVDLVTMQEALAAVLGRPVDLIEEAALRNPYRRAAILESKQLVYAA
jgi:predicted nucleotidyltransferase